MDTQKTNIVLCMGSSCFARGNAENLAQIEEFIEAHNLDIEIDLSGSRCEGDCAQGPNIIIDGQAYHEVDEEKLSKLLNNLLKK